MFRGQLAVTGYLTIFLKRVLFQQGAKEFLMLNILYNIRVTELDLAAHRLCVLDKLTRFL